MLDVFLQSSINCGTIRIADRPLSLDWGRDNEAQTKNKHFKNTSKIPYYNLTPKLQTIQEKFCKLIFDFRLFRSRQLQFLIEENNLHCEYQSWMWDKMDYNKLWFGIISSFCICVFACPNQESICHKRLQMNLTTKTAEKTLSL